jgi:sensor c-di-GMP phosphodiesterase-like protein
MVWNINLSLLDITDPNILKFLQLRLEDYSSLRRITIEITAQNLLV